VKLAYEAYDSAGKAVRGSVEAPDERSARDQLARQGLIVLSVGAGGRRADGPAAPRAPRGRGVSHKLDHLVDFSRQLGMLATTGTPLADALSALERQATDEAWAAILRKLSRQVEQGAPLSEAMASGLPIVATRVEGVPEAVRHGREGVLAPPADADALADAIAAIIEGRYTWRKMSELARQRHAEAFSDMSMAAGLARVYRRLLEG